MILKFLILLHCSWSYSTHKKVKEIMPISNYLLSKAIFSFDYTFIYTPSAVNSFRNLHNSTNFLIMYKFWYLNQNVAIKDNLDAKKNSTWRREKIQKFKIWIIVALKCQLFFIISLKTWSISILYDAKPRASNINIHIHIFCWLLTPKLFDIAA